MTTEPTPDPVDALLAAGAAKQPKERQTITVPIVVEIIPHNTLMMSMGVGKADGGGRHGDIYMGLGGSIMLQVRPTGGDHTSIYATYLVSPKDVVQALMDISPLPEGVTPAQEAPQPEAKPKRRQ